MNRNATASILIVLAIGIYFTVTKGFIADIKEVKVVNDQYTSAIANAEQLIKVREQVLKAYNSLTDADRDRLNKMVPGTVDNIRLVIDLTSIGKRHGLTLDNITASTPEKTATPKTTTNTPRVSKVPDGTIPTPTLDSVTVSFSVTAPYLEFISFLQDIEANLRIMDISSLKVAASDKGLYDFDVELKTYWLRQQ
jgi:Tfp pilus assembly protein PilO